MFIRVWELPWAVWVVSKRQQRIFSEALKLKPDSAENHDNLGVALAQTGQLDEAIEHFKKALEINNSLQIARDHLDIVQQEIEKDRRRSDLSTRP